MSADEVRRLKAVQEAQAAAIQRMQMQMQANQARRPVEEEEEIYPNHQQYQQPQQQAQPQYQQVDPNQAMINHIINEAGNRAAQQAVQNMQIQNEAEDKARKRMERLVEEFPAIKDEDSLLTIKSRDAYARLHNDRPDLDNAAKYEMAVREAATLIGARPVNASVEDIVNSDFVMPASHNPARSTRTPKSRLTPNIIANAQLMGINVDPATPEGKQNLAKLSEYSARFNADQDETAYRYK